jgi:hypothetical protein
MQNAASVGQAQRSRKNSLLVAGLGAALASALTIAMTAGQLSSAASAQGAQQRSARAYRAR